MIAAFLTTVGLSATLSTPLAPAAVADTTRTTGVPASWQIPAPSGSTGVPAAAGSTAAAGRLGTPAGFGAARRAANPLGALESRYGPLGVVLVATGSGKTASWGSLSTGVAWSTIKVPLSVAAVRAARGRPTAATNALIRRAITTSDNAAAQRLWVGLGGGSRAAAAVNAVLANGGDRRTRVPARRLRAGFSVFGQTSWTLAASARYAANLPCQRTAAPVLTQMGRITPGQRWGLGVWGASARFKGGWGPNRRGAYLVRQLGVLTLRDGSQVGVAIASQPKSGSFRDGTAALTAVARWLSTRAVVKPSGRCRR